MPLPPRFAISAALALIVLPIASAAPKGRPRGAAEDHLMHGDVWALAGRCDEAVKSYRAALAAAPGNSRARLHLAHCLARTGQRAEADGILAKLATAAGPARLDALREIGDLALSAGEFVAAIAAYERALAAAPADVEARSGLLDALTGLARTGDAAARERGLALASVLKAEASADASVRRHAEEMEGLLKYGDAGEDLVLARSKLAAGDAQGALPLLEKLTAAHADLEEAQFLLGNAYLAPEVTRRDDARRAFGRAPHVKEARLALATDAYESGELDAALGHLRAATQIDPQYQAAYYQTGLIEKERGDSDAARRAWQRALGLDPKSELGRWASTKLQVLSGQIESLSEGQVLDSASEIGIGQALAKQLETAFGRADDPPLQARLDGILRKLTAVADRPAGEVRYRVELVAMPMINALTLPGGTILVFSGLSDLIKAKMGDSDDAWAAVLAHECAHAALRHGMGMVQVASSFGHGHAIGAGAAGEVGAGQLAELMNTVSRAHEFEADQFGALYSYRAGFNPASSLRLFEQMRSQMGEIPRGMNHPTHGERIDRVRDYLLDLRAKVRGFDQAVKALHDGDYDSAASKFEVFLGVYPDSVSARSNLGVALHRKALRALEPASRFRRATDVDPNSRARKIELRAGEVGVAGLRAAAIDERLLREAAAEYQGALQLDPSYTFAQVNLGAALDDLKDRRRARELLERAVRGAPQSREAWNNLGAVAAETGDTKRALEALEKATGLDGTYPDALFNLALVYEQASRNQDAAAAWDRYLALDPKSGWAEVGRTRRARLR